MRKARLGLILTSSLLLTLVATTDSFAFMKDGCAAGECKDCHSLSRDEAGKILAGMVDNVVNVEMSPVKGLWFVDVERGGQRFPVYIDFSKGYVINGAVLRVATKENVTDARYQSLNKVDASKIPLTNAVVVGDPAAPQKVIVFTDPDCPFCAKLHEEVKKVVARNPQVSFHMILYPHSPNPGTYKKAKAILCEKSAKLLDDAFAKKALPEPKCETKAVDENTALAERFGIKGTPTLVLPDGRVVVGYRDAESLLSILGTPKTATGAKP